MKMSFALFNLGGGEMILVLTLLLILSGSKIQSIDWDSLSRPIGMILGILLSLTIIGMLALGCGLL